MKSRFRYDLKLQEASELLHRYSRQTYDLIRRIKAEVQRHNTSSLKITMKLMAAKTTRLSAEDTRSLYVKKRDLVMVQLMAMSSPRRASM